MPPDRSHRRNRSHVRCKRGEDYAHVAAQIFPPLGLPLTFGYADRYILCTIERLYAIIAAQSLRSVPRGHHRRVRAVTSTGWDYGEGDVLRPFVYLWIRGGGRLGLSLRAWRKRFAVRRRFPQSKCGAKLHYATQTITVTVAAGMVRTHAGGASPWFRRDYENGLPRTSTPKIK